MAKAGRLQKKRRAFEKTAELISDMERRAIAAEREANDRYLAGYLENRIGEEFAGRIRGVTRFGLFVTLDETGADGFVPARTLGPERYDFIEEKHALIGAQIGGAYRLGQAVKVKLLEAAPLRGGLTFEMVSDPIEDPDFKPSKRPRHVPWRKAERPARLRKER